MLLVAIPSLAIASAPALQPLAPQVLAPTQGATRLLLESNLPRLCESTHPSKRETELLLSGLAAAAQGYALHIVGTRAAIEYAQSSYPGDGITSFGSMLLSYVSFVPAFTLLATSSPASPLDARGAPNVCRHSCTYVLCVHSG